MFTLQKTLAEMVENGVEYVFMEVSAHALYFDKVAGIEFQATIFTNLTQDHLEYFITMENYSLAKKRFFEKDLSQNAIINIDDEFGKTLLKQDIPYITYSINGNSKFPCENTYIIISTAPSTYSNIYVAA